MPIATVMSPDGRTATVNVPDGATDEMMHEKFAQVKSLLASQGAAQKAAEAETGPMTPAEPMSPAPKPIPKYSLMGQVGSQLGSSLADVGRYAVATSERGATTGATIGGIGGGLLAGPPGAVAGAGIGGTLGALSGGAKVPEAINEGGRSALYETVPAVGGMGMRAGARGVAAYFPKFARFVEHWSPGILRTEQAVEGATNVGGARGVPAAAAGEKVIGRSVAGELPTGGSLQQSLKRGREARNALFDDLAANPNVAAHPVPLHNVTTALGNVPEDLPATIASLPLSANARAILSGGLQHGHLTFEQARLVEKELGAVGYRRAAATGSATPQQYLGRQLGDALRTDIEDFLSHAGGDAGGVFHLALDAHRRLKSVEESSVRQMLNKNPEDITRVLFTPGNVQEIRDLKAVIPESDFQDLVQSGIDRLLANVADPAKRMGPQQAVRFAEQVKRLGATEQLNELVGPEKAQALQALGAQLSRRWGSTEPTTASEATRFLVSRLVGGGLAGLGLQQTAHMGGVPMVPALDYGPLATGGALTLGMLTPGGRRTLGTAGAQLIGRQFRGEQR